MHVHRGDEATAILVFHGQFDLYRGIRTCTSLYMYIACSRE